MNAHLWLKQLIVSTGHINQFIVHIQCRWCWFFLFMSKEGAFVYVGSAFYTISTRMGTSVSLASWSLLLLLLLLLGLLCMLKHFICPFIDMVRSEASDLSVIQSGVRKVLSKSKAAAILRLAFHDAGTFNLSDNSGFICLVNVEYINGIEIFTFLFVSQFFFLFNKANTSFSLINSPPINCCRGDEWFNCIWTW